MAFLGLVFRVAERRTWSAASQAAEPSSVPPQQTQLRGIRPMPYDNDPQLDGYLRRRSSERPPDFEFEWTPEHIRAADSGKGLRWLFWLALLILIALVNFVPRPAYAPAANPAPSPPPAFAPSASNTEEPQSPPRHSPSRSQTAAPRSATRIPQRCICRQ